MTVSIDSLDTATRSIGSQLLARTRDLDSNQLGGFIQKQMMNLGMRDEAVKAQLFRFVDVLPALATPNLIAGHLREYLSSVRSHLPAPAATLVEWLPANGWLGRGVASVAKRGAREMARNFISADTVEEAPAAVERLRKQRLAFTVDLLGEAVVSEAEAGIYQLTYLRLIQTLADSMRKLPGDELLDTDADGQPVPRANVSVKLSSLFSQFDPIDPTGTSLAVRERLRPILRLARSQGVFVNIDMEQYSFKPLTLQIFREILDEPEFRDWPDVGIAVQAYLRDSGSDLQELATWAMRRNTPIWVRLVKGAYWDFEVITARQNGWSVPVFLNKPETDANYERQTEFLIENRRWLRPAIASHNLRSIGKALALAQAYRLGPRAIEFQMLFGMADGMKKALVELGQRVRVYAPVGELLPGMAYLVRRLLENTSNESFLRAGFLEHQSEERLLADPARLSSTKDTTVPDQSKFNGESNMDRIVRPFENEPMADFSVNINRQQMRDALTAVASQLGQTFPLVIGGETVERDRQITSVNPSHKRRIVAKVACATVDDVNHAVATAASAFESWRETPVEVRSAMLERAADIMARRRFELSAWEVYETGKPWREADADVAEAIDFCRFYARSAIQLFSPQLRDVPGEENRTIYEPRGVCAVIAPWNFPLAILCGMTAAALATGNTAIMKPAEQAVAVAAKLMEIFREAGVPEGVVNYLPGIGEEVGPKLVSHPATAMIAFTGSRSVGLQILADAAKVSPGQRHLKKVITELGGKNAIIVDDDADLDQAVLGTVASAFGYAGQKCSACSRVILLESAHDLFLSRLIEATRSVKVGPAEDPSSALGPVIDETAYRRIMATIEKAKAQHKLAFAGDVSTLGDEGFYIPPHVFGDVDPGSWLAQEEIFGPVLAVMRAKNLDQAISIANDTAYALTGGIYSRSPEHIERARRSFRVGNLYINRKITGALVDRQPFGGFALSGGGSKAGGTDYLLNFVVSRTITENTLRHGFAPSTSE